MVMEKSLYYDSIGIIAKRGETEPQYLFRAVQIETEYRILKQGIQASDSFNAVRKFDVSDSSPIEEFGFEKPLMPVIQVDDKYFSPFQIGTIIRFKPVIDNNTMYTVPLIRRSLYGKSAKTTKEHEELHTIRALMEDKDIVKKFFTKKTKKEALLSYFYDRKSVNALPLRLYDELLPYFSDESRLINGIKNLPETVKTNTDAIEYFLDKVYVKRPKRDAILAGAVSTGLGGVGLALGSNPLTFVPFTVLYGARAIGKSCEYYMNRRESKDFVKTAETLEGLCQETGYSFLPAAARLEMNEAKTSLDEIKSKGMEKFFEEKIKNPVDGFRWEIIYKRTKDTKCLSKPEL